MHGVITARIVITHLFRHKFPIDAWHSVGHIFTNKMREDAGGNQQDGDDIGREYQHHKPDPDHLPLGLQAQPYRARREPHQIKIEQRNQKP